MSGSFLPTFTLQFRKGIGNDKGGTGMRVGKTDIVLDAKLNQPKRTVQTKCQKGRAIASRFPGFEVICIALITWFFFTLENIKKKAEAPLTHSNTIPFSVQPQDHRLSSFLFFGLAIDFSFLGQAQHWFCFFWSRRSTLIVILYSPFP